MFAIHSVVLGSGLFDVITGSIAVLGQLLMIRPVFGRRSMSGSDGAVAVDGSQTAAVV